jgi:glycerol-3-phosphate dehydrogenase (NAD(P)+)
MLGQQGQHVRWYVRRPELRESILALGENATNLPGVRLPMAHLTIVPRAEEALAGVKGALVVVPAAFLAQEWPATEVDVIRQLAWVGVAIKGLLPSGQTPCEYLAGSGGCMPTQLVTLLGPGHAEEVSTHQPTELTLCGPTQLTHQMADCLGAPHLQWCHTPDRAGAEWAAILKNIYAILVGYARGAGAGDNLLAALVSACLRELEATLHLLAPLPLAQSWPPPRNVLQSVYAGDLLVTAYSQHSRNQRLGLALGQGQGQALSTWLANGQTPPEGYFIAQSLAQRLDPLPPLLGATMQLLDPSQPVSTTPSLLELMRLCAWV